ncbi:hypothetical protein M4D54_09630 [Brachybacterium sp. p3-SID1565]|uniref:hypothetical protein n=1 Tax=Brachybacterium sp. p3-SID1565 TaxID=2916046 RepID=UPI0021A8F40F|nr:hypothetical protein [Brachybacterium sp. p3-SID1565]MCT1385880.1 hypothetical protein [Brachybacterium sp. p3-SID1565]
MVDQDRLQQWSRVAAEEAQAKDHSAPEIAGFTEHEAPWRFEVLVDNLSQVADSVLDLGEDLPDASAGTYDLVVSRFRGIDAGEIASLLQPDGTFLTEQAGSDDLAEVHEELCAISGPSAQPAAPTVTLMEMENALVRSGLTIERADAHRGHYTFEEPEALLRYAARMPWLPTPHPDAPGLERALARLAARFEDGPLEATASRFVLLARAPGTPDAGRLDLSSLPDDDLKVPRV